MDMSRARKTRKLFNVPGKDALLGILSLGALAAATTMEGRTALER
jgi:hypothetical protein